LEWIYLNDKKPLRVETYAPDNQGILVDAAFITIVRLDDMSVVLDRTAIPSSGLHAGYVEYIVQPTITGIEGNYVADFDIVLAGTELSYKIFFNVLPIPSYTAREQELINALAMRLKDNRPNLYRVDEPDRKWWDEELYSFLYYALSDLNSCPPVWTGYDFISLPMVLESMLLLGAQITALMAEATLQAANDFSYNDNGLTVTLSRSSKYMAVAQQLWSWYTVQLARIKRLIGFRNITWTGVKTERMPISVRRPLSMLPHLETIFGREGAV